MEYETQDAHLDESGSPPDEHSLVLRAQGGDQLAFEVLYERYNDRICRYLTRGVRTDPGGLSEGVGGFTEPA